MKKFLHIGPSLLIILAIAASVIPVQLFHQHKENYNQSSAKHVISLQKHEVKCCDVHEEALRFTAILPKVETSNINLKSIKTITPNITKGVLIYVDEPNNKAPPVFAA